MEQVQEIQSELDDILKDNHELWLDLAKYMEYMDEFEAEVKKAEEHLNRQESIGDFGVFSFNSNFNGQFSDFLTKLEETTELPDLYQSDESKNWLFNFL